MAKSSNLHDGSHLEARDPSYIASWLPVGELFARLYFRIRVSGLESIPADNPVLFVGNHSGGLTTPDTAMAAHSFWKYCGCERPIYALVHPSIFAMPKMASHIARVGGLAATSRMAQTVLAADASLLIYPGGGGEAYRPRSERHLVKLGDQSAYVRLAMRYRAPVVPVVCIGGHDTLLVIDDGEERARMLGLDRYGVDRLPLTYSFPAGLSLCPQYNLPFPARIDIAFGAPIYLDGFTTSASRNHDAVEWCHRHIEKQMQTMLDELVRARNNERAVRKAAA